MRKNRSIPFGYCMINGKYVINKSESDAVKQIFNEYLQGKTLNEISAGMTVPYHSDTPIWNKNMVKRILENERYTGKREYPQIIDVNVFSQAQYTRLQKPSRAGTKNRIPETEALPPIKEYRPTENIRRLTNEINRLLDSENISKDEIKRLIFKCAEEKYKVL